MLRTLGAAFAAGTVFLSAGWGFQNDTGPVLAATVRARPQPAASITADIRVDASLVLIPAHVTNATGAIVSNLTKADFQITEDGVPQTITQFSLDDAPASIGLIYDCSGSMHGKMHRSEAAAEAFFRTSNPKDEFFLVEVADRAKLKEPFTAQPDDILSQLARVRPFGFTALLDGLQVGMKQMEQAHNLRKALVVLSDGGDNHSRRNVREIKNALLESDVQLYAMGLFDQGRHKLSSEERRGPDLLDELAAETGGRLYPVTSLDDLPSISQRISNDVRTEYMLGYLAPSNNRDGKYHRVKVTVATPGLHTYYRQGYFAPQ